VARLIASRSRCGASRSLLSNLSPIFLFRLRTFMLPCVRPLDASSIFANLYGIARNKIIEAVVL
jgi:hypothetical protein